MTLHSSSSSAVKFRKNTRRIFMNECDEIATSVLVRIGARLQHIVTCEWSTAVGAWCAKHTRTHCHVVLAARGGMLRQHAQQAMRIQYVPAS